MKITKKDLQELYDTMSVTEIGEFLGVPRSTVYYHMRKHGIESRSRSDAQARYIKSNGHQRTGKAHKEETRALISDKARQFWESEEGDEQRKRLAALRAQEWSDSSVKKRKSVVNRLNDAARPVPGELSRFGKLLFEFLSQYEQVTQGMRLTMGHLSDITIESQKVVLELVLPISVYGKDEEDQMNIRYEKITDQILQQGYRVVIIEDKSNSLSQARCQRVYDQLVDFFNNPQTKTLKIVS